MALGAFLAGVMLAGSNYRHELEADIEPFRGLLLALFFMGVGMSIDMDVVMARLALIIVAAIVITAQGGHPWPHCSAQPARTAAMGCELG
jgi:Kef-type K+ transport system membrane component KefB